MSPTEPNKKKKFKTTEDPMTKANVKSDLWDRCIWDQDDELNFYSLSRAEKCVIRVAKKIMCLVSKN